MNPHDESSDGSRLVTRRHALISGGTAALALSLPGQALARRRRRRLLSHLRRSSYHGLVGERFTIAGTSTRLTLVSVRDLNPHQARSDNAFALVLRARRGSAPLALSHPLGLSHPTLGRFDFLLTRGKTSLKGQDYVAVINRLHA